MPQARKMDEQVNVRFNSKMLALIDRALETGIANDRSEFVRMSVAVKLERMGLFQR